MSEERPGKGDFVASLSDKVDVRDEYSADFFLWTAAQAAMLRRLAAGEAVNAQVDWRNLIEEIESLGASQRREVGSRLRVLCQQLLKWCHQKRQSSSWQRTIMEQRRELLGLFEQSPSLRKFVASEKVFRVCFQHGREDAERETKLRSLPHYSPWTFEQIIDPTFWP
jgi:hypothetical protein